jgi:uncharacterized SAM-binding protein YcdF (DUF218 family)
MVVFGLLQFYGPFFIKNGPVNLMSLGIIFLANYFFTLFLIFLVGAIVYDHLTRQLDSAYYVVLGAGLIGDHKVSKQLGNRIKLAVDAAKAYVVRHQRYPIIIFSGGKGGNDRPSEAQAMQAYAVEKFGYPVEFTMLEDQSTTTRENMRFSIQKIQAHSQGRVHHFVFLRVNIMFFGPSSKRIFCRLTRTAMAVIPHGISGLTRLFVNMLPCLICIGGGMPW